MAEATEVGLSIADVAAQVQHLLSVGQGRRARELAASLVTSDPDNPVAHVVLSQVLLVQDELAGAQAAADEAVRLAPDDDRGHLQRARVLFARGRFAAAEAAALQAVSLEPGESSAHLLYARLLTACERYRHALTAVEEAVALDPDDADAHQVRAGLLLHTHPRDWIVSEEAAVRALSLDPEDADAHAVLGAVRMRAGRTAQAEGCFRSALQRDPANELALHGLAEAVMGRSWLYRPFLRYSVWMEKASQGTRIAVVVGAWAVVSALNGLLAGLTGLRSLVSYTYLAFCAYTWFATPVTRWILGRHYPWLRALA